MEITRIDIMEIGGICGALLAIGGLAFWTYYALRKLVKPIKHIQDATAATLRYSITVAHRDYTKRGAIGRHALDSLLTMHEEYKNLGGNGFAEALIAEIKALPIDMGLPRERSRNDE